MGNDYLHKNFPFLGTGKITLSCRSQLRSSDRGLDMVGDGELLGHGGELFSCNSPLVLHEFVYEPPADTRNLTIT